MTFEVGHNYMSTWTKAEKNKMRGYVRREQPEDAELTVDDEPLQDYQLKAGGQWKSNMPKIQN